MKIRYVFADEVVDFRASATVQPVIVHSSILQPGRMMLGGSDVSDGRVQPNVEVFVFFSRDLEPEVRAVSGNIPVLKPLSISRAQRPGPHSEGGRSAKSIRSGSL